MGYLKGNEPLMHLRCNNTYMWHYRVAEVEEDAGEGAVLGALEIVCWKLRLLLSFTSYLERANALEVFAHADFHEENGAGSNCASQKRYVVTCIGRPKRKLVV